MLLAVFSGFALAMLAPWLPRLAGRMTGWAVAVFPASLAAYFASWLPAIGDGMAPRESYVWAAELGLRLSFRLDGLSLLMALLITGIGALVAVYAGGYLAGHRRLGLFFAYLLVFMSAMLGLVLADNVLCLFVFWELTTISSFLLIGFEHEREAARSAALMSLLVTAFGGLALLAGLLLLGHMAGTSEISDLLTRRDLAGDRLFVPALVLVLLGAFTKSAQFPFHFWLPAAMQAPTPVSAYLHSATMVKAGVYLLARFQPLFAGHEIWHGAVTGVGAATMVYAAFLAYQSSDLKQILANATVCVLGTLTMLIGIGTDQAIGAAMAVLLAHALYKGALFLVAGAVDHATGERDVDRLGGLWRKMPVTALAAGLAALAMAGLIPTFAFIAKEGFYEATQHAEVAAWLLTAASVLANVCLVAVAGLVWIKPFAGRPSDAVRAAHEAPLSLWLGPLVLASGGLGLGFYAKILGERLLGPTAAAVAGRPIELELALWHGVNRTLILSAATVAAGIVLYGAQRWLRQVERVQAVVARFGFAQAYHRLLAGLNVLARWQTRVLQNGYLRLYVTMIVLTTVGLVWVTLAKELPNLKWPSSWDLKFHEVVLAGLILASALLAVVSRSRLGAIVGLGVVGYGVAAIYVLFGAPDLAMTQFVVETLTVILLVLAFLRLPRFRPRSPRGARLRDAAVSAATGGTITLLLLFATGQRSEGAASRFYADHSLSGGHGRNIVNVILVDFRALDTLGEITVLGIAGVGVYALLRLRLGIVPQMPGGARQPIADMPEQSFREMERRGSSVTVAGEPHPAGPTPAAPQSRQEDPP
ncbi:MAG TPA: putative monovalent cation/H+ antiporter subunit A [Planctomycetaceae bacterium]|nr:putative monovalent cation/H+ antiporter subunit A [Planctomycetaceae bacterium]